MTTNFSKFRKLLLEHKCGFTTFSCYSFRYHKTMFYARLDVKVGDDWFFSPFCKSESNLLCALTRPFF